MSYLKSVDSSKYKLHWGIHAGTINSREPCEPEYFDSKESAIEYVNNQLNNHVFKDFGYVLWYANLEDLQTGEKICNILPGAHYIR